MGYVGKVFRIIPQDGWWIETSDGQKYHGKGSASLLEKLEEINEKPDQKIKGLIIKSHAGPAGMVDKNDGNFFIPTSDEQNNNYVYVGETDVLPILTKKLDKNSYVSLRGCMSSEAAKNVASFLPPGTTVKGNVIPSVGIPSTVWNISIWWRVYKSDNNKQTK
jgi:hypothetical protein